MATIAEQIQGVYDRLPRQNTSEAQNARRRQEEIESVMHHRLLWKGWPCLSDKFLTVLVEAANDYVEGHAEADSHLMILMLLLASGRPDLTANLFADDPELDSKDLETLTIQWRELGFPVDLREKLRSALR